MNPSARLGVTLFSFGGDFWHRRRDMAGTLAVVASLGPDQGVEIAGAQSLAGYPQVPDEQVRTFRDAVQETGVVPVCYSAYLERARTAAVLDPLDCLPLIEAEIDLARRLGFPAVRLNTATPALVAALAPVSERTGMTLLVELATEPTTDPAAASLIDALEDLQCSGLGVLQDFSAFVRAIPDPFVRSCVADGAPAEAMDTITSAWAQGVTLSDLLVEVDAMPGLDQVEHGLSRQSAHITYALFRRGSPAGLATVLPHLRHVQTKFFALAADGSEPCIPYPELIETLCRDGYSGRLHSEFEGFLWDDTLDARQQISSQQEYLRRLWSDARSDHAS